MDTLCKQCGHVMVIQQITVAEEGRTIRLFCPNPKCHTLMTVHERLAEKEREIKTHYA